MKKVFLFFGVALLTLVSCGKSEKDNTPKGPVQNATIEVNMTVDGKSSASIRMKTEDASATIKAVLDDESVEDATVYVEVDEDWLETQSLELLPEDFYSMDSDYFDFPAGETSASIDIEFYVEDMPLGKSYVLPLIMAPESLFLEEGSHNRVVFTVTHAPNKDIEMICFYEVNDVNPLNAGEVLLEDGTPFFDYVVLFAYNINYNSSEDRVYLHSNPNCKALLDESEIYLQPLRQKGIKVLMGLLGNHDAAGLCQLSDWGAKEWAKEVAAAVKQYGMDGVSLDDEYSGSPGSGKWFASRSSAAGSRLCYELKQAMIDAKCDNSIVSVFQYGSLSSVQSVDGHDPSEFVDQMVANYGGRGSKQGNMTNKWCSGGSYECNWGSYPSGADAKSAQDAGYGFLMYFNPDPAKYRNYYGDNGHFSKAAQGVYGQKCKPMTQWWKKTGEGKYDPNPYKW